MATFTSRELEVMRILWTHGSLTPPEIQERHPRDLKNAALRSYLTILVEKGHVVRHRRGRAYVYSAKTRREKSLRARLRELIQGYCDGSASALVCQLMKQEKLSAEELAAIRRLANEELERR